MARVSGLVDQKAQRWALLQLERAHTQPFLEQRLLRRRRGRGHHGHRHRLHIGLLEAAVREDCECERPARLEEFLFHGGQPHANHMLTVDRQQQPADRDAKQLRLSVRRDALDGDPHATTHLVHRESERASSAKDVVARHAVRKSPLAKGARWNPRSSHEPFSN